MENFSIHSLNLKGIMKDGAGAYAILADGQTSASFVLKGGVLFDFRNKRVPGVTGTIQMRRKTVTLMTADKDVQPLKMGEAGENLKKAAP
jgi:Tfp pilus assembly protein PilP